MKTLLSVLIVLVLCSVSHAQRSYLLPPIPSVPAYVNQTIVIPTVPTGVYVEPWNTGGWRSYGAVSSYVPGAQYYAAPSYYQVPRYYAPAYRGWSSGRCVGGRCR